MCKDGSEADCARLVGNDDAAAVGKLVRLPENVSLFGSFESGVLLI